MAVMIQNVAEWEAWERGQLRNEPVDIAKNFALLDAMYEQARALGVFPVADPLEGLEEKICFAFALNVPTTHPKNRAEL